MQKDQQEKDNLSILTADVRILILKKIHDRINTIDRIAEKMQMPAQSVKKHIERLRAAKLVEEKEDKNKKKIWALTLKGLALLDPEEKKMWIAGSLFIVSIAAATAAYIQTRIGLRYNPQIQASGAQIQPLLIVLLIITAAFAVFLFISSRKRKKYEEFLKFKGRA